MKVHLVSLGGRDARPEKAYSNLAAARVFLTGLGFREESEGYWVRGEYAGNQTSADYAEATIETLTVI